MKAVCGHSAQRKMNFTKCCWAHINTPKSQNLTVYREEERLTTFVNLENEEKNFSRRGTYSITRGLMKESDLLLEKNEASHLLRSVTLQNTLRSISSVDWLKEKSSVVQFDSSLLLKKYNMRVKHYDYSFSKFFNNF